MIRVGEKVRIRDKASNYYNGYLQLGAYEKSYEVLHISDDKVILGTRCGITGSLDVSCIVNIKDIRKDDNNHAKKE